MAALRVCRLPKHSCRGMGERRACAMTLRRSGDEGGRAPGTHADERNREICQGCLWSTRAHQNAFVCRLRGNSLSSDRHMNLTCVRGTLQAVNSCEVCGEVAHEGCARHVPHDCRPVAVPASQMTHLWRPAGVATSATEDESEGPVQVCHYCRQLCEADMFISEPIWECAWCATVAHVRCYHEVRGSPSTPPPQSQAGLHARARTRAHAQVRTCGHTHTRIVQCCLELYQCRHNWLQYFACLETLQSTLTARTMCEGQWYII